MSRHTVWFAECDICHANAEAPTRLTLKVELDHAGWIQARRKRKIIDVCADCSDDFGALTEAPHGG